jgi:hypothetical protein
VGEAYYKRTLSTFSTFRTGVIAEVKSKSMADGIQI